MEAYTRAPLATLFEAPGRNTRLSGFDPEEDEEPPPKDHLSKVLEEAQPIGRSSMGEYWITGYRPRTVAEGTRFLKDLGLPKDRSRAVQV